ncbi:endonuclease III [Corallococcus sp. AB004]|uniref:endonuclease III n=1 Tax=Corallococcus TaxID=83461 RepID=UPI000EA17F45|nr:MULTISPECIES: endonuclease III [Corallococcus]RKI29091.1 endonuclease III [Corallococcus sp. AB004]NPC76027.1 endonuclease III [Corallococcus exiguus]NPD29982.1 endonuclease III [Corallococcus exiguus]NRD50703.1 endonuclease III [Corallococcus exiguus]RKH97184.1 endonuclease III [Corallococcus sp. AB038B]
MKPAALVPVVLERLREKYPDAKYELNWNTPFELLVATILAAQCTDERVNRVTAELWKKYDGPQALADADTAELEEDLKPTGFFKQKTKTVQAMSRALLDAHKGEVPDRMEDLVELPGVARKTANVVLNTAFQQASGIIVDTHVARVSQRLGLTKQEKPEAIETDLMKLVPKDDWTFFGPAVVLHGRYTCVAKKPKCSECLLNDVCPKLGVA